MSRAVQILLDQVGARRVDTIKEGFRNNLLYGAVWRMEDLWDYYSYMTRYPLVGEDEFATHYKRHAELLAIDFVAEQFPDISKLFGFSLQGPYTPEVKERAR